MQADALSSPGSDVRYAMHSDPRKRVHVRRARSAKELLELVTSEAAAAAAAATTATTATAADTPTKERGHVTINDRPWQNRVYLSTDLAAAAPTSPRRRASSEAAVPTTLTHPTQSSPVPLAAPPATPRFLSKRGGKRGEK
jgi:hypothetical protein